MPRLNSIDELDSVQNLEHRAVLKALRDTGETVTEIARRFKISRSAAYYVIETYLPEGYIENRNQSLQLGRLMDVASERTYSDDDPITVIDAAAATVPQADVESAWTAAEAAVLQGATPRVKSLYRLLSGSTDQDGKPMLPSYSTIKSAAKESLGVCPSPRDIVAARKIFRQAHPGCREDTDAPERTTPVLSTAPKKASGSSRLILEAGGMKLVLEGEVPGGAEGLRTVIEAFAAASGGAR